MTAPTPADRSRISRIHAILYTGGADLPDPHEGPPEGPQFQDRAIARCRSWASRHDWHVSAVVREDSDDAAPLRRTGLQRALGLLGGQVTVLLVAAGLEISDQVEEFHEVCAAAERTGGFLHVLDTSDPCPSDTRRPTMRPEMPAVDDARPHLETLAAILNDRGSTGYATRP
jgi:hypothetical protein